METTNNVQTLTIDGVTRQIEDVGARQLIASLQTALNSLTSGDTTTAIESFNEIIAFLENISDSSTLQGIIAGLNTTIAAKYSKPSTGIPATDLAQAVQTILNSVANKANSTDVYTKSQTYSKSEVDAAVAGKQDALTFDDAPTAGSDNAVKSKGIKAALDNLLANITIGQNGNWFIGQTDTEVKARGVDGINVSDPADIEVVHNLDDEKSENFDPTSQVAVLGADMGKELADMIDAISGGFAASVQVINGKNTLVFDSLTTPAIIASVQSINFGEVEYGESKSLTFTVRGRWLNNGISINSGSTKVVCSPASTNGGNATIITATYTPTSDDETLSTSIVLSSTGAESITIPVTGAGVEQVVPVITLSPSTVKIGTASGTSASGIINVKGSNLEGDITLAVSGSGLSLSAATVAKADAEASEGKDITVTFDGSADVTGTITASTTGGSDATATVNGNVVTPFASNAQFNIGNLRYIVRSDRSKVAVQQNGTSKPTGAVTIPAYVNDYGITPITGGSTPGEGASYEVQKILTGAFDENGNITSVDIQGQVIDIGNNAFRKCSSLTSINIPASVVTLGEFSLQQTALKTVHIYAGNTMTMKSAAFNGFYGATQGNTDCHVYLHADTLPVIDPSAQYPPFPTFYGTLHLKAGVQLSGEWATRCANATVVNDL